MKNDPLKARILVVDDEPGLREMLAILGRQAIFVRLIHLSHTGPSSVTLILWTSLRKGLRVVGTPVAE